MDIIIPRRLLIARGAIPLEIGIGQKFQSVFCALSIIRNVVIAFDSFGEILNFFRTLADGDTVCGAEFVHSQIVGNSQHRGRSRPPPCR